MRPTDRLSRFLDSDSPVPSVAIMELDTVHCADCCTYVCSLYGWTVQRACRYAVKSNNSKLLVCTHSSGAVLNTKVWDLAVKRNSYACLGTLYKLGYPWKELNRHIVVVNTDPTQVYKQRRLIAAAALSLPLLRLAICWWY